jgi:serine/threonine protein kinase
MTLAPSTCLGHYRIVEKIGAGGMGEVYRAKDHKLGRDVAIKVLREELATDPERLRRFEQEARSASALNHPNIITIHDIRLRQMAKAEGYGGQVGKAEDVDFIVMEFVDGRTLRQMLSEGPLPTKKLLQLATQIAEGLAKAHSAGIIHRDLKPENLMVTSDGYVKILDFGLAKLRSSDSETDSEAATATREGTILGTAGYMSPEQAKGQTADFRTDQFSLGSILYEMATGKRAFQRDSSVQTLSAIIEDEPEPLSHEIPLGLRSTIQRCLTKESEGRYASTQDLRKGP